jgi:hypothetical protein
MVSSTPTLRRIAELEVERERLYATRGWRWLTVAERDRLIEIRRDLDSAWEQRRAEKVGAKAGHLVEVVVGAAEWGSRRRPRLPGRRTA